MVSSPAHWLAFVMDPKASEQLVYLRGQRILIAFHFLAALTAIGAGLLLTRSPRPGVAVAMGLMFTAALWCIFRAYGLSDGLTRKILGTLPRLAGLALSLLLVILGWQEISTAGRIATLPVQLTDPASYLAIKGGLLVIGGLLLAYWAVEPWIPKWDRIFPPKTPRKRDNKE